MSGVPAERQEFADRLATVLRRLDRRGQLDRVVEKIGRGDCERRDLMRWSKGEKMPADILIALISEVPEADGNLLIKGSGYTLKSEPSPEDADIFEAMAAASDWTTDAALRFGDGQHCHKDRAALRRKARENVVPLFKKLAGD